MDFDATIRLRLRVPFRASHPPVEPELPAHPGEPPTAPLQRKREPDVDYQVRLREHDDACRAHAAAVAGHPAACVAAREAHAARVEEARIAAARLAETELVDRVTKALAKQGVVLEVIIEEVAESEASS